MDLNSGADSIRIQSIDSIVKDTISAGAEPIRNTQNLGVPKRGRGRPRKNNSPNRATLEKISAEFEQKKTGPFAEGTAHSAGAGTDSPAPGAASIQSSDIPEEWIKMGLKLPYTLARDFTGYEGFKISEDTVNEAVPLAKECIDKYFPNLERSEHFPAYMLGFIVLFPLCKQTLEYQKFKNAKHVESTVENKNEATPAPNHSPKPVQGDESNPFRQVFN